MTFYLVFFLKGTWLIQNMESCVTIRRNAIPDIIYRNLSAHCEWPMFQNLHLNLSMRSPKTRRDKKLATPLPPEIFFRPTSGLSGILKSLLPFLMDKTVFEGQSTSQWNLKKCWKAPPIKETSWSSALRVNAKVFQWVKKVLSIVRKKSLKGILSFEPVFWRWTKCTLLQREGKSLS